MGLLVTLPWQYLATAQLAAERELLNAVNIGNLASTMLCFHQGVDLMSLPLGKLCRLSSVILILAGTIKAMMLL